MLEEVLSLSPEEHALLTVARLLVESLRHGVADRLPLHVCAEVHLRRSTIRLIMYSSLRTASQNVE